MTVPGLTSLTGISAGFRLLDAAAENVANLRTDGFKRHGLTLSEAPGGGVIAKTVLNTSPGPSYSIGGRVFEASNADLGEEMVSLIEAKLMVKAGIAAFRAYEETTESIIDAFA